MHESINKKHQENILHLTKEFLTNNPFAHLELREFLEPLVAKKLSNELQKEKFKHKDSDLFKFSQTQDLAAAQNGFIQDFHSFWQSDVREFIQAITQTELKTIDMSGFIYESGDYLLAHDDKLEGRKIAYILNLSENFKEADGGQLDLFETKEEHPIRIVKSIPPTFNTLTIFKVLPTSFHQVREITKKKRLSIAGWFHA